MSTLNPRPQCRNASFRKITASFVLALIALFCANVTSAFAANSNYTIDNSSTITSHRGNIQGLLNSAGSGNTVTVTGSRTGMASQLDLNIPSGVTLIWQASLSGDTFQQVPLLSISGAGGFRMESGVLENAEALGITLGSAVTGGVLITGDAQIRATGNTGIAIYQTSDGILTISGGAQVYSVYRAIDSFDVVKVNGSSSVTGGNRAISSQSGVEVSGGTVTSTGNAAAISCTQSVTVSGGTVTATGTGAAIYCYGNVTVSGSAVVSATGSGNNAISIRDGIDVAVNISGGTVSANSDAIATEGTTTKVDVTVSGGTVSSANSYAIDNAGSASAVTVSGGEVTSAGSYTIMMRNDLNTAKNVVVNGAGKVRNTGVGSAIRSNGGVEVADNALVTATTGSAIFGRNVTINGGAVFAYGTAITGNDNVIRTTSGTYTPPNANGIAIAWDNTAGVTNYAQDSKLHITAQPQTGSAYWSESGSDKGIQYANGSAGGFIPLNVTIGVGDIPPAATGVGINGAAPLVGTALTGSYTYNIGSGAGAGTDNSTFKWYRGNTATWGGSGHTEISGATSATYTPTGEDIGKYLYFEVTPSNGTVTGDAVHSAASAQAGVMVNLTAAANSTSGTAYITNTDGITSYKAVSTASLALHASLNNAVGVTWAVTSGGGSIANSTATVTSYTFPSTLSGITGPITLTATFTPDTAEPVLSDVSVDMTYETTAALHFKSTKSGTYYYLVYADAASPPNAATIIAQGTAVTKGSGSVSANQPMSVTMSGLTAGTNYKAYVVVVDLSGVSNTSAVSSCAFTTVTAQTYGLRFHANTGKMMYFNGSTETEYPSDAHWSWDGTTNTLTLTDFNLVTSAQNALLIMDGAITLNIKGANSFMSTYSGSGYSDGIVFMNNVTVTGGGTLEAIGGPAASNTSSGIDVSGTLTLESGNLTAIGGAADRSYGILLSNNKSLTINSGALTARATAGGGICQAFSVPTTFTVTLPAKYIYWVNTSNPVNPGGAGTTFPGGTAFALNANHKYVSIQEIPLSTEKGLTGVAGEDVSWLPQTGTSVSPVSGAVNVANGVTALSLTDIVVSGKSFNLYSNSGFTTEVTGSGTIALTAGSATTVYIKVTAENTSVAYYAIDINRAPDTVISIAEIDGVTPPAYGGTPATAITPTAQYTGTVTWSPADNPFKAATDYTATITLTPKSGYTLTGVESDFFFVTGALDTRNAANSGVVTAYFRPTDAPPTAPDDFTATAGDAEVTLNWTTPGNGGSAITKYQYSCGATAGYTANWVDIPSSGAATTTYTVTGLTNGTGYTFEVRAVNTVGDGATSGTQTATPTAPGLSVNGSGLYTTVAGIKAAIETALLSGNATVTGELSGVTEQLDLTIPAGKKVVWQAEYSTGSVLYLGGSGTFEISGGGSFTTTMNGGGIIVNDGGISLIVGMGGAVSGPDGYTVIRLQILTTNATLTVDGGTVNGGITADGNSMVTIKSGAVSAVTLYTGSTVFVSGGTIAAGGISKNNSAVGYYIGSNAEAFDGSFTANTDLFKLDAAPALTANGETYSGAATGYDVVATLPSGLDLTGATVTASAGSPAVNTTASTVTFSGAQNHSGVTLTVSGAKIGTITVPDFTTAAFTVHIIDATPPTLSAGTIHRTSDTEASIGFTTDEAGTAYYLVVNSGATAPTSAEVKAGTSLGSVSGTVTGKSVTLTAGAKDIYVIVEDANGNISDPLKIEAAIFPVYSISLGASGTHTFPAAQAGYGAQTPLSVTVTNTGNQATGNLTVALSGTNASAFNLSPTTVSSIAAGGTGNFTVSPKTGLAAATYTATVTVSGGNSITATFNVSFTVNPVPTYGISIGTFSNGSVVTDKTAAAEGETVTLTVYPDQGYILNVLKVFKDLNDLNSEVALSSNYAFTMPAQAVTVTATFKKTAGQEAVEAAKALIENAGFAVAQAAANTEAYVKAWLVGQINSLISGTGVSISLSDVTISSFSAATAGNAYNYYGTDGSFSFSVSLSSGGSSETAYASGTIAATTYTPPATYAVTIASTSGGTVSASPTSTTEGATVTVTIVPANGYELETISAYRTGSPSTTVALAGSGNTRTFTMPAYGVTVSATFRKTQAQLDKEAVEAAKAAIEGGTYHVAQATANETESIKTWLVNTLNTLFGQSHDMQLRSATSIDGDVTVTAITPATAGTESNPSGVNGTFTFTVSLNRGASNATATVNSGVIIATPYTVSPPTGIEDVPQPAKLYAVSTGSGLLVHGLVPGEVFSIYNISGQLQFKGKATATEQFVPLRERGIYIVVSGNRRVKAAY